MTDSQNARSFVEMSKKLENLGVSTNFNVETFSIYKRTGKEGEKEFEFYYCVKTFEEYFATADVLIDFLKKEK